MDTGEATVDQSGLDLLRQALRSINHEARNSLQCIENSLALLEDELPEDTPATRDVEKIAHATQSIHRLFERIQSYVVPLHLTHAMVPMESIWREPWAELQTLHAPRKLELVSPINGNRPLEVDRDHMRRAFHELFEALLARSLAPAEIRMEISDDGELIVIRLSMADQDQVETQWVPVLFQGPFDFGFGVANALRILTAHGGGLKAFRSDLKKNRFRYDVMLPRNRESRINGFEPAREQL